MPASLLSVFPGWNLDDPSQLAASGGLPLPAYINGSGSLRAPRRRGSGWPAGVKPKVGHWFPDGGCPDTISILARTASTSSLDWTRPPSVPITISARFASIDSDMRSKRSATATPVDSDDGVVLVDISPDSTVAEFKVALLLASSRPAPAGMLDALILWRIDMSKGDLAAIDATGGLTRGRRPTPYPATSAPPLLLADENAKVSDYLGDFRSNRSDPNAITISAWLNPLVATSLAARFDVPRFEYPMPPGIALPRQRLLPTRPLPMSSIYLESPSSFCIPPGDDNGTLAPPTAMLRCCSGGHEGQGLIGLGIFMSPTASVSDHGSSDDEAMSWPATPNFGDDEAAWVAAGPSPCTRMGEWTGADGTAADEDDDGEDSHALTPKMGQAQLYPVRSALML